MPGFRRGEIGMVVEIHFVAGQLNFRRRGSRWKFRRGKAAGLPGRQINFHRRGGDDGSILRAPVQLKFLAAGIARVCDPHAHRLVIAEARFRSALDFQPGVRLRLRVHAFENYFDARRPVVALQSVEFRAFLHIGNQNQFAAADGNPVGGIFTKFLRRRRQRQAELRSHPARRNRGQSLFRRRRALVHAPRNPFPEIDQRLRLAVERHHRNLIAGRGLF